MPATEIPVKVDGDKIYCTKNRHKGGQQIYWQCELPFTVCFGAITPIEGVSSVYGEKIGDNDFQTSAIAADAADKKIGAPVVFKYTVAVHAPSEENPDRILVEDPEIIIDP